MAWARFAGLSPFRPSVSSPLELSRDSPLSQFTVDPPEWDKSKSTPDVYVSIQLAATTTSCSILNCTISGRGAHIHPRQVMRTFETSTTKRQRTPIWLHLFGLRFTYSVEPKLPECRD